MRIHAPIAAYLGASVWTNALRESASLTPVAPPPQRCSPHFAQSKSESRTKRSDNVQLSSASAPILPPSIRMRAPEITAQSTTGNHASIQQSSSLSCPLLPNYGISHDNNGADKMVQLSKLKTGVTDLLTQLGLSGEINWRMKSADSTLGKLILRAIQPDPKIPLHVKDAKHACELIADNHQQLHSFVSQLHQSTRQNKTPPALLDQLGLRIVLEGTHSPEACLMLAKTIKQHLSEHPNHNGQGLAAFAPHPDARTEKDYITHPKANGYQSYHMSVLCETTTEQSTATHLPIELQIRTEPMHKIALQGDARHDDYKSNQRLLLDAFKAYYSTLGTISL